MPHDGHNNPSRDIGLRGIPLLDWIIDQAEENPETHDQSLWATAKPAVVTPPNRMTYPYIGYGAEYDNLYLRLKAEGPGESCGTAYCVAGWAAHATGAKINWRPHLNRNYDTNQVYVHSWDAEEVTNKDGLRMSISGYAREVLDLDGADADVLFASTNTLADIKEMRDRLFAGESIADWFGYDDEDGEY